ncbi:probable cationic amino acid transporter isoform X2 [Aethina tumida]|uniref:probable cationic amino acid transporter isoform X2 n=1 Tax=Aethina tumida TaxID=116153 RepID=UPI0021483537|nr:probable cationic amino acid transporter isoform X2 [Aethina tumida]
MGNLQDLSHGLVHWTLGTTVLTALTSSEFSGSEAIIAIVISALSSTLTALCGSALETEQTYNKKKFTSAFYFFIIWFDVLSNLTAAATCSRLASATVDYISRGHFRELLFGIESHSLGEPWPDVLGVTIIVVVSLLFMLGLEKSSTISLLLFLTVITTFVFFISIGSFHTILQFTKWYENFKVHSVKGVLTASAVLSFAFINNLSKLDKKQISNLFLITLNSIIFYIIISAFYTFMTNYRELSGTAIPLVRVFEARDVDWARAVMAVFTICIVCLVLTEILPKTFSTFVKLANRDWQVFVSSMQYQSTFTGAPVLAIFAAGSLAAILAFACPLWHLVKLLNTSNLLKCIFNLCQLLYNRYKPELCSDPLVYHTNVQYQKLNQNPSKIIRPCFSDKFKSMFGVKPTSYISRISVPKSRTFLLRNVSGEQESLLLDEYSNKSEPIEEDSQSDNEENQIISGSDGEESTDSTDIDVVVQEYKEKLKVATITKFNEKIPSTIVTSVIVGFCTFIIILGSIGLSLILFNIYMFTWPSIIGIMLSYLIILVMPQNSIEKSNESALLSCISSTNIVVSLTINIVISSTIIIDIWQGIVFWLIVHFCSGDANVAPVMAWCLISLMQRSTVPTSKKTSFTSTKRHILIQFT